MRNAERSIPLISLQDYLTGHNRTKFITEFGRAIEETGFAVLQDHPICHALILHMYHLAEELFNIDEDVLLAFHIKEGRCQRGYTPFGIEKAKNHHLADLKRFWMFGRERLKHNPDVRVYQNNVWPPVDGFRPTMLRMYEDLEDVSYILLEALEQFLGLKHDELRNLAENGDSVFRLTHYPSLMAEPADGHLRSSPHEDINLLTLHVDATRPGLEVMGNDNVWYLVSPPHNTIVVNIGDMLQMYTRNHLRSTTHRVSNRDIGKAKYSASFFLHPVPEAVLDRDRQYTAAEYLNERLNETGFTGESHDNLRSA